MGLIFFFNKKGAVDILCSLEVTHMFMLNCEF